MTLPPLVTLDINSVTLTLLVLGIYIAIISLVSFWYKERLFIPTSLICTCLGMAAGPYGLNWIDPRGKWTGGDAETLNSLSFQIARIVIALQVMFAGLDLPRRYFKKEALSLFILLLPIMVIAWFVSGAFIFLIIPRLSFIESLCIAACVTPTDPVLANAIVRGNFAEKYVPEPVRFLISAEAGANDGLGYPFLFFALLEMKRHTGDGSPSSLGAAVWHWIVGTWIYQIVLAVAIGTFVGVAASLLLTLAHKRGLVDPQIYLVYSMGVAFFILGVMGVIGSDDLLACFVAGSVMEFFSEQDAIDTKHAQEVVDFFLDTGVFIYIGSLFHWRDYTSGLLQPWRVVVLCIAILCLRRPPWIFAVYKFMPPIDTHLDVLFTAWFGPVGVSGLYYAILAHENLAGLENRTELRETIIPVVLAIALSSIIVHGLTVPFISILLLPFRRPSVKTIEA